MVNPDNELALKTENLIPSGNEPPQIEHAHLRGFGGWLYVVSIGLLLTLGDALIYIINTLLPIYTDGLITELYKDDWKYGLMIIYETVTYSLYVVFPIVLGYLGWKKMRRVRTLAIIFYLVSFVFNVIYYFISNSIVGLATPEFMNEQGRNIVKSLITCLIWIPYFINSKRVKYTFVN
ncbi:DUF2569 domain-containing protein [Paenibacillus sp. 2RAB27]|uniref:DUF2569 domain-containing protein n=1 Tax=Paenibacillus sp. 2RAB27 TaxID=3232991 RepID=UPI003F9A058E